MTGRFSRSIEISLTLISVSSIEHGDGNQKYVMVSGFAQSPNEPSQVKMVVVLMKKLPATIDVSARMTQTMNIITSIAYSEAGKEEDEGWDEIREGLVKEAVNVRDLN